jgi:hypothetical protein
MSYLARDPRSGIDSKAIAASSRRPDAGMTTDRSEGCA